MKDIFKAVLVQIHIIISATSFSWLLARLVVPHFRSMPNDFIMFTAVLIAVNMILFGMVSLGDTLQERYKVTRHKQQNSKKQKKPPLSNELLLTKFFIQEKEKVQA